MHWGRLLPKLGEGRLSEGTTCHGLFEHLCGAGGTTSVLPFKMFLVLVLSTWYWSGCFELLLLLLFTVVVCYCCFCLLVLIHLLYVCIYC